MPPSAILLYQVRFSGIAVLVHESSTGYRQSADIVVRAEGLTDSCCLRLTGSISVVRLSIYLELLAQIATADVARRAG